MRRSEALAAQQRRSPRGRRGDEQRGERRGQNVAGALIVYAAQMAFAALAGIYLAMAKRA